MFHYFDLVQLGAPLLFHSNNWLHAYLFLQNTLQVDRLTLLNFRTSSTRPFPCDTFQNHKEIIIPVERARVLRHCQIHVWATKKPLDYIHPTRLSWFFLWPRLNTPVSQLLAELWMFWISIICTKSRAQMTSCW